jgi:hypothetical protein
MSLSRSFKYRPYSDGVKPFSIGLALLDPARWIEPDERLVAELGEKERLLAEARDRVVVAEAETLTAQGEVRDALVSHLSTAHPDLYRRRGDEVEIVPAGRRVALKHDLPLVAAARLVQDDLCLMRRGAEGWRLAAAVLTAPSAWSLLEQFGRPMGDIHTAVPGYAETMAAKVERIFDHLAADKPLWRLNWSLYDDDVLFHPETKHTARRWSGPDGRFGEQAFVRVERQTLRRMPVSGDILFTIRVYVDPVAAFRTHPEGARLAAGLAESLAGLDEAQLRYKNLLADREKIIEALAEIR